MLCTICSAPKHIDIHPCTCVLNRELKRGQRGAADALCVRVCFQYTKSNSLRSGVATAVGRG